MVATRARQPLNRAWLGSVTDDLIRRSRVPVLLIRAHEEFAGAAPGLGRLLVPLDGSSGAERVIPHAVALARAFDAELQLVRVCGPREDALEAERYLAEVRARLRPTGVAAESLIVAHHDVAEALADAAEERGAEVLALASRYRGGLSRLVFGNIPESLVRLGSRPVFVVGERVPAPHGADTRVVAWS